MAQPFRTVEYQGSGAQSQQYVQAGDASRALESDIAYQNRQLKTSGEALIQQNAADLRNKERIDEIQLQNARLSMSQVSASNETILKGRQLIGQQRLDNLKMREDQAQEIQKMRILQEQARVEMDLKMKEQSNAALTQFGQQMIQFSQSLWKAKAEKINAFNQEQRALGQIDQILGFGDIKTGDLIKVDQAQYTRLAKQGETALLVSQLEAQGLSNDAARLRASNPWYLYGREEAALINSAQELPDFLRKFARAAEQPGPNGEPPLLAKGTADYNIQLRAVVLNGMKNFLMSKGITDMNPVLVAKYLQEGFLNSVASISKEFNAENNSLLRQAAESQAVGDAINSFHMFSDMSVVDRNVQQVFNQSGSEGLAHLLKAAISNAKYTKDPSAVAALMQHPQMQQFRGTYEQFEMDRIAQAQADLEKENKKSAEAMLFNFTERAYALESGAGLQQLQEEVIAQAKASLPFGLAGDVIDKVRAFRVQDAGNLQAQVERIVEYGTPERIRKELENQNLSASQKEKLQDALKAQEKMLTPEAKQLLEAAKDLISASRLFPPNVNGMVGAAPFLKDDLDKALRYRQEKLEARSKTYWSRPGATAEGYRQWLQDSNKDLIEDKIDVDTQNFKVPELGRDALLKPTTRLLPAGGVAKQPYNGRQVVWMIETNTRQQLLRGDFGQINPTTAVVATKAEIQQWSTEYEQGKLNPRMLQLSVRSRIGNKTATARQFLESQAQLHNLQGTLAEPTFADPLAARPTGSPPAGGGPGAPVTVQQARQTALSRGLSQRGAVWFSNMMSEESGGRPTAVHDGGTGYGLFGHRLDRREALRQYAASKGIDPSDGQMQLEFALNEIKTKYPGVWDIVTAPNPSFNDLWRAAKTWEGFSERVYAHRSQSLRNALGE